MTDHIFLVQSESVAGQEDEFNDWYTEQHLKDILAIPGFVSGQRFRVADVQRPGTAEPVHRFLAIYEISGDPEQALAGLSAALPHMHVSDALDREKGTLTHLYESVTDRLSAE